MAGSNSEAIQQILLKLTVGECLNRDYVRTKFRQNLWGSCFFFVLIWHGMTPAHHIYIEYCKKSNQFLTVDLFDILQQIKNMHVFNQYTSVFCTSFVDPCFWLCNVQGESAILSAHHIHHYNCTLLYMVTQCGGIYVSKPTSTETIIIC